MDFGYLSSAHHPAHFRSNALQRTIMERLAFVTCLLLAAQVLETCHASAPSGDLLFSVLSASRSSEPNWHKDFCTVYYSEWGHPPSLSSPSAADYYAAAITPCLCSSLNSSAERQALVAENEGCTFYKQALTAQRANAKLLIIAYNNSQLNSLADYGNSFDPNITTTPISLVVAMVTNTTGSELSWYLNSSSDLHLSVHTPPTPAIDPSSVLTLLIAVATVVFGSILANKPWNFLRYDLLTRRDDPHPVQTSDSAASEVQGSRGVATMVLSLAVFVLLVCTFLVLLYLFYYPLVYVVIAVYCLGAFVGLYCLLSPFVALIPFGADWRLPPNKLPLLRLRPDPRFFLTLIVCAAVVVWWAVERHSSYAWIIQDILGFAFMTLLFGRLLFYRAGYLALLMIVLLFYDVFMVFVTPLLTKDHDSIMVKAATGGPGSTEQLPIVFIAPKFLESPIDVVCAEYLNYFPYSLLGYGDVGIPGLLVAMSLKFDLQRGRWRWCKLYYAVSAIAYAAGLVVTYIALVLMQTAQPALLYLVPITLGSVTITALVRKEFYLFFTGKPHSKNFSCRSHSSSEGEEGKGEESKGEEEEEEEEVTSGEEEHALISEESEQL